MVQCHSIMAHLHFEIQNNHSLSLSQNLKAYLNLKFKIKTSLHRPTCQIVMSGDLSFSGIAISPRDLQYKNPLRLRSIESRSGSPPSVALANRGLQCKNPLRVRSEESRFGSQWAEERIKKRSAPTPRELL